MHTKISVLAQLLAFSAGAILVQSSSATAATLNTARIEELTGAKALLDEKAGASK